MRRRAGDTKKTKSAVSSRLQIAPARLGEKRQGQKTGGQTEGDGSDRCPLLRTGGQPQ